MHIINCVNSVSDVHIMVANARDSQKNHEEHDFGGPNPDFLAGPEDSSKSLKRGQKWPKKGQKRGFCWSHTVRILIAKNGQKTLFFVISQR